MFELYAVLGGVGVFLAVVGVGIWVSKKLGEAEARHQAKMRQLQTQRTLAKMLARRDRTRSELVDWVRDNGDE